MTVEIEFGKGTIMGALPATILIIAIGAMKTTLTADIIQMSLIGTVMTGGHRADRTDGITARVIIIRKTFMTITTETHGSIESTLQPIIHVTSSGMA